MLHGVVPKGPPSSIFVHIWASKIRNTWFVSRNHFLPGFVEGKGMGSLSILQSWGGGLRNSDMLV